MFFVVFVFGSVFFVFFFGFVFFVEVHTLWALQGFLSMCVFTARRTCVACMVRPQQRLARDRFLRGVVGSALRALARRQKRRQLVVFAAPITAPGFWTPLNIAWTVNPPSRL